MVRSKRKTRVASRSARAKLAKKRSVSVSNGGTRSNFSAYGRASRKIRRVRTVARSRRNGNHRGEATALKRFSALHVTLVRNFETGVRSFQRQNYERAREIFGKLAQASVVEVADRARTYLRMCEQRLGPKQVSPRSAAELYDLGVAQLNARQVEAALESLRRADKREPNRDYIQYALAAAHALRGDVESALEHLKAATESRPANRFRARNDEDFRSLASDPRFRRLVRPQVLPNLN